MVRREVSKLDSGGGGGSQHRGTLFRGHAGAYRPCCVATLATTRWKTGGNVAGGELKTDLKVAG